MIATLVNCATVIVGSLLGLLFHSRMKDSLRAIIYVGAGLVSLIIGVKMSFSATRIVFLAFALILGGILGDWWNVEGGILKLGDLLRRTFAKGETGSSFALGFLNSSVLFCVGAMTLVGAFKAGTEGDYELILTKSVMDGFMARGYPVRSSGSTVEGSVRSANGSSSSRSGWSGHAMRPGASFGLVSTLAGRSSQWQRAKECLRPLRNGRLVGLRLTT